MKTLSLALLLSLAPAAASAQRVYIDVTSPDFRPLPLALSPFLADAVSSAQAAELEATLRGDLQMSGLFDLLDPRAFLADPGEGVAAGTIRFARWADVGAEGLVKAEVHVRGEQVSAEFHLYEVRAQREVLYRVHDASLRGVRSVAHAFADDVIQYYTREPGVFRTRIAAVRQSRGRREVVLFDADGKNPEVAYSDTTIAVLPSWRPDGRGLLFTGYQRGKPEVWALELGKTTPRLLADQGDLATGGVYSPDGARIAYTASIDGNSDIWVMNADGSGAHRLTRDPANDTSPSWSPDGRRIAFVSDRPGRPQVYVMNADGTGQRRLTFQGNYNQVPRWSPRGDLIVFTGRDERNAYDIFVIAPDTGQIRRVTQGDGSINTEPSWAPNGRLIVFSSNRTGRPQLVVSTLSGERQTVITSDPAGLSTPAWGPLP